MNFRPPITDLSGAELVKRGLITGVCMADYHAGPGTSRSGLVEVLRSPAHYRAYVEREKKETPALRFGRIAHTYVLEPHESHLVIAPEGDRRTKAVKAAWEVAEAEAAETGAEIVTKAESEHLRGMRESLYAHPYAGRLLRLAGPIECCVWWYDEPSGELCRIRPDKVIQSNGCDIIIDLKTAEDASPAGFSKACAKHVYHMQAAMYEDGYAAGTGRRVEGFVFLAVEKEPPYAVGVYELTREDVEYGRMLYKDALMTMAQAKCERRWPAYSDQIETISLPRWAKKEITNDY